jgi:hypothetical protein
MLESFEMSDFEDRLQKAIQRGQQARVLGDASQEADAATEEEMRLKHSQFRNELSEHIENCLRKLCDHFPGFDYSTVLNEKGWGARISRDDIKLGRGTAKNEYSRLEVLVRESLNRSNFKFLKDATKDILKQIVDGIVLEFAEQYSAHS